MGNYSARKTIKISKKKIFWKIIQKIYKFPGKKAKIFTKNLGEIPQKIPEFPIKKITKKYYSHFVHFWFHSLHFSNDCAAF
jgi:hypothetical protein